MLFKKLIEKIKKKKGTKKHIKVYGIFPFNPDFDPKCGKAPDDQPVSFTATYEQAITVINRRVYLRHYEHYRSWCALRGLPSGFGSESWPQYAATLFDEDGMAHDIEDAYTIEELTYTTESFASFLRMFTECEPLLLPHEIPAELMNYLYRKGNESPDLPDHIDRLMDAEPSSVPLVQSAIDQLNAQADAAEAKRERDDKPTTNQA